MNGPSPILVVHLFRDLSRRLLDLLRSLDHQQWHLPASSSQRRVKDLAAHLLDGSLRRLSMQRDGCVGDEGAGGPAGGESLLDFLNRLNAEWETAARRLSPRVLVDLIGWADGQLADLLESLDPFAPAFFPVAWAGQDDSPNWMDIGREYTEKWLHTRQLFDATARASTISGRELFHPCLDLFMRALPFTYRAVEAAEGACVSVRITGEAGGEWFIVRVGGAWVQTVEEPAAPDARFSIGQESAWRLFTKRLDRHAALTLYPDIRIEGDRDLGGHVMEMVSVMA